MKRVDNYKDINQVMAAIRLQIIDSVEFCYNYIPALDNPEQLFKYLKPLLTFKHDQPETETLQSAQTLFFDNVHGKAGAGDCDCFTILASAAFIAQGWGKFDIILAGRNKINPVHIYNQINWNGKNYTFDLTEPKFNQKRKYKFEQILPITFLN